MKLEEDGPAAIAAGREYHDGREGIDPRQISDHVPVPATAKVSSLLA
jgi:hypothetical protein